MPVPSRPVAAAQDVRYWNLQRALARLQVVPFLRGAGVEVTGRMVLDLGCGEGGVAAELALAGAGAVGVDRDAGRIAAGRGLAAAAGIELDLRVDDARREGGSEDRYDLAILRDLLEHVPEPRRVLRATADRLVPGGRLVISFPPFYSPFGLHQQLLTGQPLRWIPCLSLLPRTWIERALRPGPFAADIRELLHCRLSIARFENAVRAEGFRIVTRRGYLVRPSHALRFGLPVIPCSPLLRIPLARELAISGVIYLLRASPPEAGPPAPLRSMR